jgi:hypothetical protein
VRFSALPRAVLLQCAMIFSVRGAAACDDSARCLGRCCCRARVFLLRAGLLVLQRVAACSDAAVCESAVCNRMARKGRSKARKQHPGQLRVSCLAALGKGPYSEIFRLY